MAVETDIQETVERGGSLEEGIQGGFGGEVGNNEYKIWGEVKEGHFFFFLQYFPTQIDRKMRNAIVYLKCCIL